MKRKRYTIAQLRQLESRWKDRVVRAARKLDEYSKRLARALKNDERTRPPEKTLGEVMDTREPSPAYQREVDVFSVPCTTCNVGPGAECLSNGKTRAPHKARIRHAADYAQQAKDW